MGSLVVVTGPTVVIPMLRSVRPNSRIANVLRWEGIMIDPIGALLAVLVYESIISLSAGGDLSHTPFLFLKLLRLVAVSPQRELNAIACMRYRPEFGEHNLFSLAVVPDKTGADKRQVAARHKGRTLFCRDLTFSKFASLLNQGAKIRLTALTENFDYENQLQENQSKLYPLFAINKAGRIHVITEENPVSPTPGWSVISLGYAESINTKGKSGSDI